MELLSSSHLGKKDKMNRQPLAVLAPLVPDAEFWTSAVCIIKFIQGSSPIFPTHSFLSVISFDG